MIQIDLTDRPSWLVLFSLGLAIFLTALVAALVVLTGWLPPWSLVFVFILAGAFPWARLATLTLEIAERQRDAAIAEAEARRVLAERSWMGQPAESAENPARALALDLLRASIAHPDYPATGQRIAPATTIGWSGRQWQSAVDSLRPHLITWRGSKGGGGTVVREGTVGDLLAAVESGETEVHPPASAA